MNEDHLLAHYERIADAPDAIARLRRFILDLAVRGKLVPQDPNDEPASELLKRIVAEKARLVKAGEIRKPPLLEAISHAETPCALPSGWVWVRIGDIFDYDAGTKRDPKELLQDRWLLELEDIEKDTSTVLERLRVRDRDSLSTKSEFEVGDVLYGKLRPYLNKVVVADEPGYSTTEIVVIRPFLKLCPQYCALAFRRPDFVAYVERLGRGTKMPRLRTPDAIVAAFPLPPLAEQHRIVAKVDELMALCDRLEAARAERERMRDRLTAASLARLNAPDPDTFRDDARFALDALPVLTTRHDQIKHLRQTILNLAVRGKLVSQDLGDEPATELLKRIAKEKANLIKSGIAKREKPTTLETVPFELPTTWTWCALGQLSQLITKGSSPKWQGLGYVNRDIGLLFITSENVGNFNLRKLDELKYVEARFKDVEPRSMLRKGDILINLVGASIGRTAIYDLEEEANINQAVALVRLVDPEIGSSTDYLLKFLNSDAAVVLMLGSRVITAQPNISLADVNGFPIPLPPLAEQHRIVAKVDALMAICDRLEASLATAADTRRRLLDALLVEALAPADAREMEAAE